MGSGPNSHTSQMVKKMKKKVKSFSQLQICFLAPQIRERMLAQVQHCSALHTVSPCMGTTSIIPACFGSTLPQVLGFLLSNSQHW